MASFTKRPAQKVTREQLYEQVWARPVRTVAVDYGISDVALAKICKKLDVPRPPVGYWNRVQHGQSPPRLALPPRRRDIPADAEIVGAVSAAPPPPPGSKPVFPVIPVPETLSHPHATVRRIREELDKKPFNNGAIALYGSHETVVRVTSAGRERALILLDALAKALATRGHELAFGVRHEGRKTFYSLAAHVGEQAVDVFLYESTKQIQHVKTKAELEAKARGKSIFIPTYDFPPTGKFRLTVGRRYRPSGRTWSGGKRRKLETLLGEIVVGIEETARMQIEEDREREARRKADAKWARRQEIARRKVEHEKRLEADLFGMVRAWRDADGVRAFLAAVEERTPPELRSKGFAAWISWAKGRAEALDPLRKPEQIPKRVGFAAGGDDDQDDQDADLQDGGELEPPPSLPSTASVSSEWTHGPAGPRPPRT
jgi:hypothetical protein